ncbi:hypothetical protein Hanom_Chr09g00802591 [Helianthus anomalus]
MHTYFLYFKFQIRIFRIKSVTYTPSFTPCRVTSVFHPPTYKLFTGLQRKVLQNR